MKRMPVRLLVIITALACLCGACIFVSAEEVPYESYTYWTGMSDERKAVYNHRMYEPEQLITAKSLEIAEFSKINNICTGNDGSVYILDAASRIVILDSSYNFVKEIGALEGGERYDEANSIFVYGDGTIYICDTLGGRVIHINRDGVILDTVTLPNSPLIPDDFEYRPTNVTVDSNGYIYVISDGSYYGALLYSKDKSFIGFYGANTVNATVSSVLTNIKNRVFPNNKKLSNTAQALPYCFVNICCDSDGFVYTCNGYTENYANEGQIRKLSPGTGKNILNSDSTNFVDEKINTTYNDGALSRQDIMDIEVDSDGFIYGLESAYGRIFMYDREGRMLTAFGNGVGNGSQTGTFITVSGMALNGNDVLVSDSTANTVTRFTLNDYGSKVKSLIFTTLDGDYDNIKQGWEEIRSIDNNFQWAYIGLAKSYYNDGDYENAMKYAKLGYDRDTYALAFENQRRDFINDNFFLFFGIIILVAAGLIALLVISSKKKLVLVKNAQVKLMFNTMLHPSNTFTAVKEKGEGSIILCIVSLVCYYVVTVLQPICGGFLFYKYDPERFNSFWILIRSVGLVMLWIAANWLVCTLLSGKGTLREITVVTCYSLWPLIFTKLISLVLTNILIPSEASFLSILDVIGLLVFLLLMIIGLLKIHDFTMLRLVGTSTLALLGVAAIVFLLIMMIMLYQQFGGFIATLFSEILTL